MQCDPGAKKLIKEKKTSSVPFPFFLSSPYFLSKDNKLLSRPSDLHLHASVMHSKSYLKQRIRNVGLSQIDFSDRFKAFAKFQIHLHQWARKLFCNFAGISKRIHQHGLWQDDVCHCCNSVSENDTVHVLTCDCELLSRYREATMDAFSSNCIRLEDE